MNYSKHKKPDRAKRADEMMMQWADPKMVAGALGISTGSALKYIYALGYERRYLTADEIAIVSKYRLSKLNPTQ